MLTRSGISYNIKDDKTNYYLDLVKKFQDWKNKVNNLALKQLKLSCDELPDIDYYNLFVEGITAEQVKDKLVYDFYMEMLN